MTEINLNTIVSNRDNTREPAPTLQGLGYGIVEPVEGSGKPSLFALALGTPDDKHRFLTLVEQHAEELVHLALNIAQHGQLQNCRVRSVGNDQYVLTFGARRSLAILYLHAKNGKPATVVATVSQADEKAAVIESASENIHLPPSYIDQAHLFKRLQDQGMAVNQIAKVCPMGKATEQNIRHRLRLLELPPQDQLKVHHGKLSQDKALKLLKKRGGEETNKPKKSTQRKKRDQPKDHPVNTEGDLRTTLQEFITRFSAIDLKHWSPTNPDEVKRLADQAITLLSDVKKMHPKIMTR